MFGRTEIDSQYWWINNIKAFEIKGFCEHDLQRTSEIEPLTACKQMNKNF